MHTTPLKCFITFADSRMKKALQRIKVQAESMQYFDKIFIYSEKELDSDFAQRWEHKLHANCRGYGYWLWKPYLILKTLHSLPDDSTLLYCDAGSHLNTKGKKNLLKYFAELQNDDLGIKAFSVSLLAKPRIEKYWSKGDIFKYFQCENMPEITDSIQIEATAIFVKKCHTSIKFMEEWYNTIDSQFHLIDDTPSRTPNFPEFIEHRHDQSIFSILFKLHSGKPLASGKTVPFISSNPIWNMRDKGLKKSDPGKLHHLKVWITQHIKYYIFSIKNIFG